jgi:hypothetical protein
MERLLMMAVLTESFSVKVLTPAACGSSAHWSAQDAASKNNIEKTDIFFIIILGFNYIR